MTTATTTTVITMGIHYKWLKHLPNNVFNQLKLAHNFRENLVEAWYDYQNAVEAIWEQYPTIVQANLDLEQRLQAERDIKQRLTDLRILQKTKRPTGPDADLAHSDLKAARAATKLARAAVKLTKDSCPTVPDDLMQAGKNRILAESQLRKDYSTQHGLYYDTAYTVLQQHRVAVKRVQSDRRQISSQAGSNNAQQQMPNLRHHRFEGTGRLSVFLAGRNGSNTRDVLEIAQEDGPHRNTLQISFPDRNTWDNATNAQRKQLGRLLVRFKVSAGNVSTDPQIIAEIPVQLHRLPPANAVIKQAILVIKKIGNRRVGQINLVCTVPTPEVVIPENTLYAHFGWRKEDDRVRAMTWRATEPLTDWPQIAAMDKYRDLAQVIEMDEDLCGGRVYLPLQWMEKYLHVEQLQSDRDLLTNQIREELVAWLKTVPPVPHPWRVDPQTNDPEIISPTSVAHWKNPANFAHLALAWRDNPLDLPGGTAIADALESWRIFDKRSKDIIDNTKNKALRRRDDIYRQVAALLSNYYDEFITEDVNYNKVIKQATNDVSVHNELVQRLNKQRSLTAVSVLKTALFSAAQREGLSTTEVSASHITNNHFECDTLNFRVNGEMEILCQTCHVKYDVDDNAIKHIAARG